jgi:hypothetical protein
VTLVMSSPAMLLSLPSVRPMVGFVTKLVIEKVSIASAVRWMMTGHLLQDRAYWPCTSKPLTLTTLRHRTVGWPAHPADGQDVRRHWL